MEREVYAVVENIDTELSNGYKVCEVFTSLEQAKELMLKLNYEITVEIIDEDGIEAIFEDFYHPDLIEKFIDKFLERHFNFEDLSFDQFKEMQEIILFESEQYGWGENNNFFEIKRIAQFL